MPTYTPANNAKLGFDQARFLLGDTGKLLDEAGAAVWLLDDAEIAAPIEEFGFGEGVAQCADALVSRFAQEPDQYADEAGVDIRWSERIAAWRALAKRLRSGEIRTQAEATGDPAGPRSGLLTGVSTDGLRF